MYVYLEDQGVVLGEACVPLWTVPFFRIVENCLICGVCTLDIHEGNFAIYSVEKIAELFFEPQYPMTSC